MRATILTISQFLFILPLSHHSYAENCGQREVALYLANGMFTDKVAARKAADELAQVARHPVELAYNLNEDALTELLQVAQQKNEEIIRVLWQELAGTVPILGDDSQFLYGNLLKSLRDSMIEISKRYDRERYLHDPDLRQHVQAYQNDLAQGRSVSVVAHSQGNFYANAAGELLGESAKGRYVVMGVAVPTSKIFGDGPYLTRRDDKIMTAVRFTRGALPANIEGDREASPTGHEFITQYLHGGKVESAFENLLRSILWDENSNELYEPSYTHESLRPFWRYALNLKTDVFRKLKPEECIATYMFFRLYNYSGEKCDKRSLTALVDEINYCRKGEWTSKPRMGGWALCFLSIHDGGLARGSMDIINFQWEHKECFSAQEGMDKNLILPNLDAAIYLLSHPPVRPVP